MKEAIYKLPQDFINRLKKIYPQEYPRIAETFLNKKPTTFRINYSKIDLTGLRRELQEQRIKFRELSFPPGAFILKTPLRTLQNSRLYEEGKIYVQNLSSMLPVLFLAPDPKNTILDLCAAPGAKTTQIVSLAPGVQVTAIEKIRTRYYKLLASLKIQGVESAQVHLLDASWVRKKFPDSFDKILADVPCSAEGRFFIQNPKSYKYWKPRKVKEMVHKQKKLLHSAFFALREGGILVYSTCTFSPEENEGVVDWFVNKFKGKLEILPIKIPLPNARDGFTRWQDKKFCAGLRLAKRIIPTESMEGFFIAKIRKNSL